MEDLLIIQKIEGMMRYGYQAEAQTLRFLQAGEREQDTIFTVGIGWEF